MSVIKVENLSYIYSAGTPFQKIAVDDISFEIEKGEFVGVIGHTGSGKSTLVQHLNGLLRPTSGSVFIDGEDMWSDPKSISKFRFKVGLVFQYPEYQLFEETVYKDISFGPRNMGLSEDEIDKAIHEAASFVGITEDELQKSPFELSGGQKRRAAIAGVIAMRPEVLVLDEPTAGLDPRGREMILGQMREYHQQNKNTVLLVSHSMEDIAKYATKALVMNRGKLFMYDDVAKVFSHRDEMAKMGLSVPQISRVFARLHEMGYPIDADVLTVEEARSQILALIGGAHGA